MSTSTLNAPHKNPLLQAEDDHPRPVDNGITTASAAPDEAELVAELTMAALVERGSTAEANEAAVKVDLLLARAFDSGDRNLIKACCAALDRKSGDAELTHRGNLGRLLALPVDQRWEDPIRTLSKDSRVNKKRGEKHWRGIVRKYLTEVKNREGIKPSVQIQNLVGASATLGDALRIMGEYCDQKPQTPIQNLFMAGGSIQKALREVESGTYVGDLPLAQQRAAEIAELIEKFQEAVGQ